MIFLSRFKRLIRLNGRSKAIIIKASST